MRDSVKGSVRRVLICVMMTSVVDAALAAAEEKASQPPGVVEQVGTAVKNFAAKVGQEASGLAKQLSESETPKKVGEELQRSAVSLGNKIEAAGQKIKESFQSK